MIQHDMMLFDHGMPRPDGTMSPDQRPEADVNIEFAMTSKMSEGAQKLAWAFRDGERQVRHRLSGAGRPAHDQHRQRARSRISFRRISLREDERGAQIGAGWDPQWHQVTDLYSTYSDKDFRLGLNAAQTTLERGRDADRSDAEEIDAHDFSRAVCGVPAHPLVVMRRDTRCGAPNDVRSAGPRRGDWTAYGHDALGSRYSPLTQITRENVSRLEVAWTYRTGDTTHTRQPAKFEATPLMVDGTLYLSTPFARVIALDPETGREKWTFDPHTDRGMNWGDWANRGVSTWLDAKTPAGDRVQAPHIRRHGRCANLRARRTHRHAVCEVRRRTA